MANQKLKPYIQHCLTSNGFVILNGKIALQLMPGSWPSSQNAHLDMHHPEQKQSLERLLCDVPYRLWCKTTAGSFEVRSMSKTRLAERIEELTGLTVKSIKDYTEPEPEQPAPAPKVADSDRMDTYNRNINQRKMHKEQKAAEAKRMQEIREKEQADYLKQQCEKREAYRRRMEAKDLQMVK